MKKNYFEEIILNLFHFLKSFRPVACLCHISTLSEEYSEEVPVKSTQVGSSILKSCL